MLTLRRVQEIKIVWVCKMFYKIPCKNIGSHWAREKEKGDIASGRLAFGSFALISPKDIVQKENTMNYLEGH